LVPSFVLGYDILSTFIATLWLFFCFSTREGRKKGKSISRSGNVGEDNVLRAGSYFQFEQMREEELSENFWTTFHIGDVRPSLFKGKRGKEEGVKE